MKKVCILFGSSSFEREVSFLTALSVYKNIKKDKYNVSVIGFDKNNNAYKVDNILDYENKKIDDVFVGKEVIDFFKEIDNIDVFFPLIHGTIGEDGVLQGILKFFNKKFVGSGVSASSICMDKRLAKICFKSAGINVVDDVNISKYEFSNIEKLNAKILDVENKLNYPVFVKPANMGSSVGISKAKNRDEFILSLDKAFLYDKDVIVEKAINARELECAVIGNDDIRAMQVGEVIPSKEFYDYEAKYSESCLSTIQIPAKIDDSLKNTIMELSKKAYKTIGCEGFARVDFLYDIDNDVLYLNEINTIPGFTKFSMFPILCSSVGLEYSDLIDELIRLAYYEKY